MVKLDHLALAVSDWRASRDWYVSLLGFAIEFELPDGGTEGLGVAALQDDAGLTLFLDQVSAPIIGGQGSLTFQIDNVDAFHALHAAGTPFVDPPGRYFWGYGAVLADPDGHRLMLYDVASMKANG